MRGWRQQVWQVGIFLLVGTMVACGGPWRDTYFKKGVDRLTQDEVRERLGPPHIAKTPVLGGDTVWTYRVSISDKELVKLSLSTVTDTVNQAASLIGKGGPDGPKAMLYCYRYMLIFDDQKVLKQWKREECVSGTRDTLNAD